MCRGAHTTPIACRCLPPPPAPPSPVLVTLGPHERLHLHQEVLLRPDHAARAADADVSNHLLSSEPAASPHQHWCLS